MIILTIDTDWAPEAATEAVLAKVRGLGVKHTVFFSSPHPENGASGPAESSPLLEAGCHPDLSRRLPLCGQGRVMPGEHREPLAMASLAHDGGVDRAEGLILDDYRRAFPEAGAVRTHRFYWHSDLARNLAAHGFVHDSSLILPYHPHLMGFKSGRLHRWPVWASDHLHLARRLPLDRLQMPNLDRPGLKIFCFHVAYLHLNIASLDDFNMIGQRLSGGACPDPGPAGPGVWTLFEMLAEKVYKHSRGWWLRDLPPEMLVNAPSKEPSP